MRKKIVLFILLFLVTGCDVTYNLNITNDEFEENIEFSLSKESTSRESALSFQGYQINVSNDTNSDKFYDFEFTEDNSYYKLDYNYVHTFNGLKKSYFVNDCYKKTKLNETDNAIIIGTSSAFKCLYLDDGSRVDKAIINITTDLEVIESNADEVNGNTYTWTITEDNYRNKPINIKIKKDQDVSQQVKDVVSDVSKNDFVKLALLYSGCIIFVIVIIYFAFKKSKKANKI